MGTGTGARAGRSTEHVAVGLLVRPDGRLLLCHRAPGRRWYPDCWDVPGGHLEDGEDARAALVRELGEELGVTAAVAGPPQVARAWPDWRLDAWVVRSWSGRVRNAAPHEHDALAWVGADVVEGWGRRGELAGDVVLDLVRAALAVPASASTGARGGPGVHHRTAPGDGAAGVRARWDPWTGPRRTT